MVYQDLDKIINTSGSGITPGVGGTDDAYNYPQSYKLIAFNTAPYDNGGDTSVQKWIPALDPDYYAIGNSLNNNYQLSTVSGTGPLSIVSKTFTFDKNVANIYNGRIKYGVYLNGNTDIRDIELDNVSGPYSIIGIDRINKKISYVESDNVSVFGRTGYIVTVGTNKYLITKIGNTIYSYRSDSFGKILDPTPVDSYTITSFPGTTLTGGSQQIVEKWDIVELAGNIGNNIYIYSITSAAKFYDFNGGGPDGPQVYSLQNRVGGYILSLNSDGTFTVVDDSLSNIITSTFNTQHGYTAYSTDCTYTRFTPYTRIIKKDSKYYLIISSGGRATRFGGPYHTATAVGIYYFDENNTTSFSPFEYNFITGEKTDGGGVITYYGYFVDRWYSDTKIVGYNVNGFISSFIASDSNSYIYEITNNSLNVVSSGSVFTVPAANPYYTIFELGGVGKITDNTQTIYTTSGKLSIYGQLTDGTGASKYMVIYDTELGNNNDDIIIRFKVDSVCSVNPGRVEFPVSLVINNNLFTSNSITLIPDYLGNSIGLQYTINYNNFYDFSNILLFGINSDHIKIELQTDNPDGLDIKMGFGLTGGDYNNPTGTNDATGDIASGRDVLPNGTYLELELEG